MVDKREEILSLHRYFIWANKMRVNFESLALKSNLDEFLVQMDLMMYMSYWYGTLFTVIEGWQDLHLEDHKIENLLVSDKIELLRRYRNGVFHYQKTYNDTRFKLTKNGLTVGVLSKPEGGKDRLSTKIINKEKEGYRLDSNAEIEYVVVRRDPITKISNSQVLCNITMNRN